MRRPSCARRQPDCATRRLDYNRKADLGRQQLVSKSEVDLARSSLEQAQAQVNSAQAQIRQQTASTQTTRVNLQRTVIRSPVDGVVLTRTIEPGQTVAASLSAPELFTIAEDLAKMKIDLPSRFRHRAGQGGPVGLHADSLPGPAVQWRVYQVPCPQPLQKL